MASDLSLNEVRTPDGTRNYYIYRIDRLGVKILKILAVTTIVRLEKIRLACLDLSVFVNLLSYSKVKGPGPYISVESPYF